MAHERLFPSLQARLERSMSIPVLVKMKDPDMFAEAAAVASGDERLGKEPRQQRVARLQDCVDDCQKDCHTFLEKMAEKEHGRMVELGFSPRKRNGSQVQQYWINNSMAVEASCDMICALAERDDVDFIVDIRPDVPLLPIAGTQLAQSATTWGLNALRIPEIWARGFRGDGIRVGHLDTGVDGEHPDLRGKIEKFAVVDFNANLFEFPSAFDTGEHGTHTAGTIVGGDESGVAIGVAPRARLFSALVIEGGQALDRVLRGMQWVAEQGVDVISISLGFTPGISFEPIFESAVNNLLFLDIFPAIAIGNEGPNTSRSPGVNVQSWSVGAVDRSLNVADFSSGLAVQRSRDRIQPDIVAPGVDVLSSVPGGYDSFNGTSMATPHVAGAVALLRQAVPGASVNTLKQVIVNTARDLGRFGDDTRFGFGFIQPLEALRSLTS